ncbi:MAG TPA: NAD(P)-dependent methylenetetrahydromethanopterin dehydrogenase [Methylophilaceae bacterium]|nr:NAD(P)-dependent methylenetetrahydromethanopterin dehydrogenase [Methylophilaceae bacterium]
MDKVSILHLITAAKNASPFDVNMAFDAGFDKIMPYTQVELKEVGGLVQDAIFSRSPSGIKRESIFIGGRDIDTAMDMLEAAKKAMVPPFAVSVFADPSGAFTTAAAMLAKVEQQLAKHFGADPGNALAGQKVSIFGATGPVAGCAAVIAARNGAQVELVAHRSVADVLAKASAYNDRYNINLGHADGTTAELKQQLVHETDIVLCAAAAGVQVISLQQMTGASRLKVVADVNAVPPLGAEGVEVSADGAGITGTNAFSIGALAIGKVKYETQHNLLKHMLAVEKPVYLDFMSAFEMARGIAGKQ